ncbi:UDP-N-acetyl glucosamine 2-epimerase [Hoylesella pleuritidis]|uniref:UDP-N-acetyl glucosamine 2-epimerase n=1 Tax=Hoylesella pleuritidis TaxID=407975 RepID=UPI0023571552|nr:UDP-N-acetyl glucosamine 2-epimerase [Hoylesella pleuritidis]
MEICIVAGARPNFIKVAPIVKAIDKARSEGQDIDFTLVYTGRKDDPTLESSIFEDLQIGRPDVYLGVDCENLNELTGQVMSAFERYLQAHKTDVVLVVDDLASTLAAAIVTKKQGLMLAHLVAGTRSFNIRMPKEINRLVIDGLSDLLFTAGEGSSSIASREGAELSKIYMVGNILMDTLRFNRNRLQRPAVLDRLGIKDYLVFTLNRKALMADRENLRRMLAGMLSAAERLPIIAPLREKAAETVRECLPEIADMFHVIAPLSYLEFGYLTANARGIITDSGNVAEEATFNGVPCITLNSYTEHIETVKVGSNVLVGEDSMRLAEAVTDIVQGRWKKCGLPERWDGRSAERIIRCLIELHGGSHSRPLSCGKGE